MHDSRINDCYIMLVIKYTGGIISGIMIIPALEPLMPSVAQSSPLDDLALELVAKANQFSGQLRPETQLSIAELVRSMNCYYSNLIEGHNTLPIDIDRAMADRYSEDPKKRALQLEARAHIELRTSNR